MDNLFADTWKKLNTRIKAAAFTKAKRDSHLGDGLKHFGPLERGHVYALLASNRDLNYLVSPEDLSRVITAMELETEPAFILIIGNGVRSGVYGDMFPEEELARLDDHSPNITGLTTIDTIYAKVCDWVQPGSGDLVFPDRSLSLIEDGVDLDSPLV